MFLQKNIISTNCPTGPKEILKNGKYGKMFGVQNYKDLAKKILHLSKKIKGSKIPSIYFKNYEKDIICEKYKNYLIKF